MRSACATASSRHGFLIGALLAGPLGGAALNLASSNGMLDLPRPGTGWATLLSSLLLAPVLEEVVFRGGVQEVLDRTALGRLGLPIGVSLGNLATSVLFAGAHALAAPAWAAAGILLPSLIFGRLKQLYPSLLPVIFVHAWFNACYLVAMTSLSPSA